jgi:ADP-heptose:LPS heptosyltransferase
LLEYYYKKGFRVFLDTLADFSWLFVQHRYRVEWINSLNPNIPYTLVDLDMAYENNPKQLHLKSYFEKAGITDYELRKPQLDFKINPTNKLFEKYCVIHTDIRPQGGRNVKLDWDEVVKHINKLGYTVIRLGKGESQRIKGAVKMQTAAVNMLQYVVAGADFFLGIDSGISHIAVAQGVPSVIFFGSVNPEYIHPDLSNVVALHNHKRKVCNEPFCWHSIKGCEGVPCYINEAEPPCIEFTTDRVIDAIKQVIK